MLQPFFSRLDEDLSASPCCTATFVDESLFMWEIIARKNKNAPGVWRPLLWIILSINTMKKRHPKRRVTLEDSLLIQLIQTAEVSHQSEGSNVSVPAAVRYQDAESTDSKATKLCSVKPDHWGNERFDRSAERNGMTEDHDASHSEQPFCSLFRNCAELKTVTKLSHFATFFCDKV